MERLDLITKWTWHPNVLVLRILEIRGGILDDRIRSQLQHGSPPDLHAGSQTYEIANNVAQILSQLLPVPQPQDIGSDQAFEGVITGIQMVEARPSEPLAAGTVYISASVTYTNGVQTEMNHTWHLQELPKFLQDMVRQVHKETNRHVKVWFAETYGNGRIDPKKWKAEKVEIFISYRGTAETAAERLFDLLGEYQDRSLFLPRMAFVDMQSGNWLDQLMDMINRCQVFIPILSKDYLTGPICRPELDLALRKHFSERSKRIVPVLIEGEPVDYQNHFLGGFHMVRALDRLDNHIDEIAYLALGLPRNPYA